MKWTIVTDSSSDLFALEAPAEGVEFRTVPFTIRVEERDYVDDDALSVPELAAAMARSRTGSHTACPAPGEWLSAYGDEGNVIAVTISSNLSGSYNSACAARDMLLEQQPDRQIAVVDSLSTGPEMCLIVRRLRSSILEGKDFDQVLADTWAYMENSRIIFALNSYNNLTRNGRMARAVGFAAHTLNLWGVGIGSPTGEIAFRRIVRGGKRAVEAIVRDLQERSSGIDAVVIDHCLNPEMAEKLRDAVRAEWPEADVTLRQTRGLCSYYAEEGGVIVGYHGGAAEAEEGTSRLHHLTDLIHTAARNIRNRGE